MDESEEVSIIPVIPEEPKTSKFLVTINKTKARKLIQQEWIGEDGVGFFFEPAEKPTSTRLCRDCLRNHKGPKCGEKRCPRCGGSDHLIGQCKKEEYQRCINCGGNHHHFFRKCREFEREMQSKNRSLPQSFKEQKQQSPRINQRWELQNNDPARSYAQVARSPQRQSDHRTEQGQTVVTELEAKMNNKMDQLEREIQSLKTQQRANQTVVDTIQDSMRATTQELMEQMRMISQTLVKLSQGQQDMKENMERMSNHTETKRIPSNRESPKETPPATPLFKSPNKPTKKSIPRNKSADNLQTNWKNAQLSYEANLTLSSRTPKERTPPKRMEKSPAHKVGRRLMEDNKRISAERDDDGKNRIISEMHQQIQTDALVSLPKHHQQISDPPSPKQQKKRIHQQEQEKQQYPQQVEQKQPNQLTTQVVIDLEIEEVPNQISTENQNTRQELPHMPSQNKSRDKEQQPDHQVNKRQ